MKQFIRNYNQFKKILNNASDKIDYIDFPIFCMTLGYLFNKIQDFHALYKALQQGLQLVGQDKLPQSQYLQWLFFLNQNPNKLDEAVLCLDNIAKGQSTDLYDELQKLFSSAEQPKKPLIAQNRYNSIDTVVMDHSDNPQKSYDDFDGQKMPFGQNFEAQKMGYHPKNNDIDADLNQIKKMQQDQEFARKLQQQEQNYMKQYKQKMGQQQTNCQICYVDLYDGQPTFLDKCGHGFHNQCLVQSFKVQISTNTFPLKCPNAQCSKQCYERDIKQILPGDLYKKYQDHTLKAYADEHGDSVSWCPTADCGYMFFYEKGDQPRFQCLQCKKQYCLNCRCQWHKDMTCAQYKVSTTVSEQDKKFLDFVKGKKFKQCPKCKFWVQKNEGCDHMTCKCKFQFCYKCGGVYMKCECYQKMLQQQKQMAQRRRIQREEAQRKKAQKAKKKQEEKQAKKGKEQEAPRGRSKRQSKK